MCYLAFPSSLMFFSNSTLESSLLTDKRHSALNDYLNKLYQDIFIKKIPKNFERLIPICVCVCKGQSLPKIRQLLKVELFKYKYYINLHMHIAYVHIHKYRHTFCMHNTYVFIVTGNGCNLVAHHHSFSHARFCLLYPAILM